MEHTVALWQVVIGAISVTVVVLLGVWRMQAGSDARNDARIDAIRTELFASIDATRAELRADINAVNQRLDTLMQMLAARGSE